MMIKICQLFLCHIRLCRNFFKVTYKDCYHKLKKLREESGFIFYERNLWEISKFYIFYKNTLKNMLATTAFLQNLKKLICE